jgi:hypothetical protein
MNTPKAQRPKATERFRCGIGGARAVIVLFEDGETTASWTAKEAQNPEQLRMDLITAANNTKHYIERNKK